MSGHVEAWSRRKISLQQAFNPWVMHTLFEYRTILKSKWRHIILRQLTQSVESIQHPVELALISVVGLLLGQL